MHLLKRSPGFLKNNFTVWTEQIDFQRNNIYLTKTVLLTPLLLLILYCQIFGVMKKIYQGFFPILMAVVVFITTGGFAVFLHHCTSKNEIFASVFINNTHKEHQGCSEKSIPGCCESFETEENESEKCDPDCCSEVVLFLRVSLDTEPVSFHNQKIEPQEIESLSDHTLIDIEEIVQLITLYNFDQPPEDCLLYGKKFILLSQQLKLDCC